MADKGAQGTRERVWVEKIDKTGDVDRLIETVFIETRKEVQPDGTVKVVTRTEVTPGDAK